MLFNLFTKEEKFFINPPDGIEGAIYLMRLFRIPSESTMFFKFGRSEGLHEKAVQDILAKEPKRAFGLDQKAVCKWYLEKIVFVFIQHYRIMSGNHYKLFVNLVNALNLDILFFERTINASKKRAKIY